MIPWQYGVHQAARDFPWRVRLARFGASPGRRADADRMSQQPESISSTLASGPAAPLGAAPDPIPPAAAPEPVAQPVAPGAEMPPQRIPRWLMRAELFLRVLLRLYLGLALCYVPWSRIFWDRNPLFVIFPTLAIYAANGAVRGMISGLGLLNLWIAFQDAIRHRDE